jgi:diacylglycerol kinase family enzyme
VRRVLLIVNPYSTGVTLDRLDAVREVLGARAELVTRQTDGRGHATKLAREAEGEFDAIVVFSGDGTYNEAVNGALGSLPFGFVPGGGASVLPRALGFPRNPVRAAQRLADSIEAWRTQRIGLGCVNGRRFTFSAGIGFDAEVVRRVDGRGRTPSGVRPGNEAFVTTIAGILFESRLHMEPQLEIEGFGRAPFVFVANGRPYTYIGPVPLRMTKTGAFDAGLDFVAPRRIVPRTLPRLAVRMFRGADGDDPEVLAGHDLDSLTVRCDRPLPLQVDGEDLGDVVEATFSAERQALQVFAAF